MKRQALIAGAVVVLGGIGAGAYFYVLPMFTSGGAATSQPKARAVASASVLGVNTEKGAELRRLLARLGTVQDIVVQGDEGALADQGRLLSEISAVVRAFEKPDWDNYAQGQTSAARKLWADVDPRSVDVSLVGPFALARASLYIGNDDAKAIALLDEARLACPHTAIEEAAVRREIPVLVSKGETQRAMLLLTDYLRRYGRSIYAWKLFRDFSAAAAKRDEFDGRDMVEKLTEATSTADRQSRIDLLLAMAAAALPAGRISLAQAAANEALSLKPDSAEDLDRAMLYQAAANAPSTRAAEALSALRQITADRLTGNDVEIREIAGYIAQTVTQNKFAPASDARNAEVEVSRTATELSRVSTAVKSADAAIEEANMIMSGTKK